MRRRLHLQSQLSLLYPKVGIDFVSFVLRSLDTLEFHFPDLDLGTINDTRIQPSRPVLIGEPVVCFRYSWWLL